MPLYRWIRGGTLVRPMAVTDEEGNPRYEPRQTKSGIWMSEPMVASFRYEDVYEPTCPHLPRGWFSRSYVLCCLQKALVSPAEWQKMYGAVPYVEEDWVPVSMPHFPVVLGGPDGRVPSRSLTESIIRIVKAHKENLERVKTSAQFRAEAGEQRQKEVEKRRHLGQEYGQDVLIAGTYHKPGQKDMVSLPTVPYKSKRKKDVN